MLISEGIYLSDQLGREVTADEVREGPCLSVLQAKMGIATKRVSKSNESPSRVKLNDSANG